MASCVRIRDAPWSGVASMTDVDLVLLAIMGISALLGLWRGLIRVLVSLAAWLMGGIAALVFGADVAQFFAGSADPRPVHLLAGYGTAFIGVFLVVVAVGWVVRRLVHSIGLSGVDRAFGFAFGLVRGVLVACLLVLVLGFTSVPQRPGWRDSQLLPLLLPAAQWVRAWLPDWSALPARPMDALQDIALGRAASQDLDPGSAAVDTIGGRGADPDRDGPEGRDLNGRDPHGAGTRDDILRGDPPRTSSNGDTTVLPQPGG